MKNKKGKKTI